MERKNQLLLLSFFTIFVAIISSHAPLDGDLWWQMEYGRRILETGSLQVDHTVFSWTKSSNSEIYSAWLAQITLYGIYENFGLLGLNVLRIFVMILPIVLAISLARIQNAPIYFWYWGVGILGFYLSRMAGGLLKPELFGHLFFTATIFGFYLIKSDIGLGTKKRIIYLIPVLTALWINTHGSFAMGGALMFLFFIGEFLNRLVSPRASIDLQLWKPIFIVIPICVVALLLNPYGYKYPLDTILQRFDDNYNQHFKNIFAYLSIFRPQLSHLWIKEIFTVLGAILILLKIETLYKRRFDFAILFSNIAMLAAANWWARASYFSPILMVFSIVFLASRSEMVHGLFQKKLSRGILVATTSFLIIAFSADQLQKAFKGDQKGNYMFAGYLNPQSEAEYYNTHYSDQRFCNGYNGGGYLMWRFKGQKKVMIDPRYFPYRAWYEKWVEMKNGKNLETHINSLDCSVWILSHHYGKIMTGLSKLQNWELAFVGRSAAVYIDTNKVVKHGETVLEPGIGSSDSLLSTARVINTLLRDKNLDAAKKVAFEANIRWRDSLNSAKSRRTYDFVRGVEHFLNKEDVAAYNYLQSAHDGPTVLNNSDRLIQAGVFSIHSHWSQKKYQRGWEIARHLLELKPESAMHNFNSAHLSLLSGNTEEDNWRKQLNNVLEQEESNKEGLPAEYFNHARKMLETGKPLNLSPLKFKDAR